MPELTCPHCKNTVYFADRTHSAVSVLDEEEKLANYHPNPGKPYKTKEYHRRSNLARYYENREEILEKARKQRAARKLARAEAQSEG